MGIGFDMPRGDQANGIDPLLNPLDSGEKGLPIQNGMASANSFPNFYQEVQQISPNHHEEGLGLPAANANGLDITMPNQNGNIPQNGDQTIPVEEKYKPAFLDLRSTN